MHTYKQRVMLNHGITSSQKGAESPAGPSSAPNLFEFQDFRLFLRHWFQWKKKIQPHYSGAVFAKKAGLNSHTILGMVTRGERNLSHLSIRAFSRALGLKGKEANYFEKLVLFNQSTKSDDKAYYLEQLAGIAQGNGRVLLTKLQNYSQYMSHWYVVAIRELVAVGDFKPDPDWISQRLKRKISRKQAEEALKLLLTLGLIEVDGATGQHKIVHPSLDIELGKVDFALRNFHREFLERAKEAVDGESLDERELSSVTMAVSEEDLVLLREKVREFRKQLIQQFPITKTVRTKVIAVNTQVLVLTGPQAQPN
jgi:uncharacterized protein (TIGR02147 family)